MARNRRRGAIQSVELLFVLPLILLLLAGLFELATLSSARQRVVSAAREGARAAAVGGDEDAVIEAVRRALGPRLAAAVDVTADRDVPSGSPVTVTVCVPAEVAAPNLFGGLGLDLTGRSVAATAVMRKE